MPAASSITLTDVNTVSHVFAPTKINSGGQSQLKDRDHSSTSAGDKKLIIDFSEADANRPTHKTKVRLIVPNEVTVDSVTSVRDFGQMICEFFVPEGMTSAELTEFMSLCEETIKNSVIQGYVTDQDELW